MKRTTMNFLIMIMIVLVALFLPFPDFARFSNLPEVLFTLIFFLILTPIIYLISSVKQRKKEELLKQSGIYEIDRMDGIQFEDYLAVLFKVNG